MAGTGNDPLVVCHQALNTENYAQLLDAAERLSEATQQRTQVHSAIRLATHHKDIANLELLADWAVNQPTPDFALFQTIVEALITIEGGMNTAIALLALNADQFPQRADALWEMLLTHYFERKAYQKCASLFRQLADKNTQQRWWLKLESIFEQTSPPHYFNWLAKFSRLDIDDYFRQRAMQDKIKMVLSSPTLFAYLLEQAAQLELGAEFYNAIILRLLCDNRFDEASQLARAWQRDPSSTMKSLCRLKTNPQYLKILKGFEAENAHSARILLVHALAHYCATGRCDSLEDIIKIEILLESDSSTPFYHQTLITTFVQTLADWLYTEQRIEDLLEFIVRHSSQYGFEQVINKLLDQYLLSKTALHIILDHAFSSRAVLHYTRADWCRLMLTDQGSVDNEVREKILFSLAEKNEFYTLQREPFTALLTPSRLIAFSKPFLQEKNHSIHKNKPAFSQLNFLIDCFIATGDLARAEALIKKMPKSGYRDAAIKKCFAAQGGRSKAMSTLLLRPLPAPKPLVADPVQDAIEAEKFHRALNLFKKQHDTLDYRNRETFLSIITGLFDALPFRQALGLAQSAYPELPFNCRYFLSEKISTFQLDDPQGFKTWLKKQTREDFLFYWPKIVEQTLAPTVQRASAPSTSVIPAQAALMELQSSPRRNKPGACVEVSSFPRRRESSTVSKTLLQHLKRLEKNFPLVSLATVSLYTVDSFYHDGLYSVAYDLRAEFVFINTLIAFKAESEKNTPEHIDLIIQRKLSTLLHLSSRHQDFEHWVMQSKVDYFNQFTHYTEYLTEDACFRIFMGYLHLKAFDAAKACVRLLNEKQTLGKVLYRFYAQGDYRTLVEHLLSDDVTRSNQYAFDQRVEDYCQGQAELMLLNALLTAGALNAEHRGVTVLRKLWLTHYQENNAAMYQRIRQAIRANPTQATLAVFEPILSRSYHFWIGGEDPDIEKLKTVLLILQTVEYDALPASIRSSCLSVIQKPLMHHAIHPPTEDTLGRLNSFFKNDNGFFDTHPLLQLRLAVLNAKQGNLELFWSQARSVLIHFVKNKAALGDAVEEIEKFLSHALPECLHLFLPTDEQRTPIYLLKVLEHFSNETLHHATLCQVIRYLTHHNKLLWAFELADALPAPVERAILLDGIREKLWGDKHRDSMQSIRCMLSEPSIKHGTIMNELRAILDRVYYQFFSSIDTSFETSRKLHFPVIYNDTTRTQTLSKAEVKTILDDLLNKRQRVTTILQQFPHVDAFLRSIQPLLQDTLDYNALDAVFLEANEHKHGRRVSQATVITPREAFHNIKGILDGFFLAIQKDIDLLAQQAQKKAKKAAKKSTVSQPNASNAGLFGRSSKPAGITIRRAKGRAPASSRASP